MADSKKRELTHKFWEAFEDSPLVMLAIDGSTTRGAPMIAQLDKNDPNLLFVRMDLGDASIWDSDMGIGNTIKMLIGQDVRDTAGKNHLETTL